MKVPDQFRSSVIRVLKELAQDQDDKIIYVSAIVLSWLAECPDNHSDIISDDLSSLIDRFILNANLHIIDYGLIMALNLLNYGNETTQLKVKQNVSQNTVRELIQDENTEEWAILTAELLDEWLCTIS
ncbi:MAG: hypothetical protein EZS28_052887 [Streblomastix strix]|uniref:Uncharacterized protein n=1 Tax=Streblomastix strix TaxID=222440 RepID=A0A5J4RTN0_9EUKA|nr:MAG: hypothetical protein EZS28_052887 [Streblomastix strix]